MSLPAQNWTTVATTKMAGISQSIVSMYSGTYISPISPRPVASAICHLRFMRDSSRSRASSPASSPGGVGLGVAGSRWCCGLVAGGGGVAGLDDGAGEVVEPDEVRGVGDGGDLGGQVHPGVGDAVELEQRLLDAPHARGAGHAADVEGAGLGLRGGCCRSGGCRWCPVRRWWSCRAPRVRCGLMRWVWCGAV